MKEIKDFMYLDMEKVSSLYSQLSGGIIQSVEASSTSSENSKNLRNYDFKIFKHEAGGTETESQALKEVRVSHHDIYNELENDLFEKGYAAEIGVDITKDAVDSGEATKIFESALCIKVEGHVVLEDYERITRIAHNYEDIVGFINSSIKSSLTEMPELKELIDKVDVMKEDIKKMRNGIGKTKKKNELVDFENNLNALLSSREIGKVDDWVIDGLKTWVRVFLPDVFNVRVYPFEESEKFHVMSNVKRKFFLDDNTESVHYLFGSKPTIKVTMLGVITSIPKKDGDSFDPMKEFDDETLEEDGNEALSFENGFRGVFRGFDGLEEMIRTCRYPRIMVQPIAIYRAIKPNRALQRISR
ncbi:hypothetical protein AYI72_22210 [Shewanella algae]|nr:hypothetical protein BS332_02045 [Shewanella algae]QTE88674.1 hypothetical protein JKK44_05065 [Shewanella algae]QXP21247.1 hypothetical protein KE621_02060 [Shewanella algae]QXP32054.1 hypothetical protein KE622_18465 [Shewanella algae]QXP36366.1 hypothetical protein KE623_18735 [Shewanella algae]